MTKKRVSVNLRNFGKKFKMRWKAPFDSSNQSQSVTGYRNVSFDEIRSGDGALEQIEHFDEFFFHSS